MQRSAVVAASVLLSGLVLTVPSVQAEWASRAHGAWRRRQRGSERVPSVILVPLGEVGAEVVLRTGWRSGARRCLPSETRAGPPSCLSRPGGRRDPDPRRLRLRRVAAGLASGALGLGYDAALRADPPVRRGRSRGAIGEGLSRTAPGGAPALLRCLRLTRAASPASNPPSIPGGRMRARSSLVLAVLLAAPLALAQDAPLFTSDFPPEEFAARRAKVYDAIGKDGGRPRPGGARARGLPPLPPVERLLLPLRGRGAARVPAPRRREPAGDALPAAPQRAARAVGGQGRSPPRTRSS